MSLHDRIFNIGRVATATVATSATLDEKSMRTVATVATVSVADDEKKGNDTQPTDRQSVCRDCPRLEAVEIQGVQVLGCLYPAEGEFPEGWRRLPADPMKCIFH